MDPKTLIIVVLLIVILYFVVKDYFSAKFNAIKSVLGAEFYGSGAKKIYDISSYDGNDFKTLKDTNTALLTYDDKTYFFYVRSIPIPIPLAQFMVENDGTFSLLGQTGWMAQQYPSQIKYALTDNNGGTTYYIGVIRV